MKKKQKNKKNNFIIDSIKKNLRFQITYFSAYVPIMQIIENSFGRNLTENELSHVLCCDNPRIGYLVGKEDVTDMIDAGVIDPVNVTISALKNAASVAKQLFLTEWILRLEEKVV